MKKLLSALLAVIGCGVSTCLAGGATLDLTAFRHKVSVVVVGSVGGTLADFPLLVRIDEDHIKGWKDSASPDGSDIRFADGRGTLLAHEIDTWTTDESGVVSGIVWVKVPELKTGTVLQMCWGAEPAALPAVDSTDVWTEYLGVWHFGEANGQIKDSTANHLDLQLTSGTMSAAEESCIGGATLAGPSTEFESLQTLVAGSTTNHGSQCTFSGFFKHSGTDYAYYPYFVRTKTSHEDTNGGFCTGFFHYDAIYFVGGSDTDAANRVGGIPAANANWLAFAAAVDGQNGKFYNLGKLHENFTFKSSVTDATAPIYIGSTGSNPESSSYDEFRIRKVTSTPAWIKAEYDAFADADFLYCGGLTQYDPDVFRYKAKVTFRGDAQEPLTNFPVLVRISKATIPGFSMSQLGAAAASAFRFQRLCFTDRNGAVLPYDVDQWDETEDGELLVWVKIPVLRPRTSVTVRWGLRKPVAFDPRTMPPSTDVWTEYLGVWHFGESAGAIKDSTANHLDLQLTSGTMSAAGESCIGGATLAGPNTEFESVQALVAGSTTNHGSQCTFSGFFKHSGSDRYYPYFVRTKTSHEDTNGGFCTGFYNYESIFFVGGSDTDAANRVGEIPAVNANWLAFAVAVDGQDGKFYNLGNLHKDFTFKSEVTDATAPIYIGGKTSNPGSSSYDEFRIRKATSSAAWVKAEYETACDPSFASYGATRKNGGGLVFMLK